VGVEIDGGGRCFSLCQRKKAPQKIRFYLVLIIEVGVMLKRLGKVCEIGGGLLIALMVVLGVIVLSDVVVGLINLNMEGWKYTPNWCGIG